MLLFNVVGVVVSGFLGAEAQNRVPKRTSSGMLDD